MNQFFADGKEFSLIERLFSAERFRKDGKGLGDDAFLFEPHPGSQWVITSDASVEGVHYRLDWINPERALRKALLANLSDVNAMGGRSRHAFFNLGARKDWGDEVFKAFGLVIRELENASGFQVSGGDTVRVSSDSFFAFTLLGEVAGNPLLRSACKPGHRVYVSGTLGGPAAGLHLLERRGRPENPLQSERSLIEAHFDPKPPLELGPLLASFEKRVGAIDISDGLSSESWHLSRQSGCRLNIHWESIPVHSGLQSWGEADIRSCALNGGEEFQLLFTGDFSKAELAQLRLAAPVAEIGEVTAGEGVFLTEAGKTTELIPEGFSH